MKKLKTFYQNKLQDIVFAVKKMPNSQFCVYITIFTLPFLLMTYQGCRKNDLNTSPSEFMETDKEPSEPITYDQGHGYIVQIDIATEDVVEDSLISIDSKTKFKFINAHSNSDSYKWTITRGFESIVTNDPVTLDTYETTFSQSGAYDVFTESYQNETLLNSASKRFVAGDSCDLTDILEIELLSGSLTADSSATFSLKDSDNFSSTKWKVTFPSGDIVEETANTIELSFDENEGALVIESSATSSDPSKSECLTYRRQNFNVTSSLNPHFNPVILTDGTDEIATSLENNDIYKYRRATSQYLQIEVLHGYTCKYQIDEDDKTDFTCHDDLINISLDSSSDCIEETINLSASDEAGSQEVSQTYYNYCPQDGNYCYLGLDTERQSHHICQSEEDDSGRVLINGSCDNSVQNGCASGVANDNIIADTNTHYRWHCEGSSGGSTAIDCQIEISAAGARNGICDNSIRNSCVYGTADDSALEDTDTHYRWQCIGTADGVTVDCQKEIP